MLAYVIRRAVYMIVLLGFLSVVVFVIIQLPPGDYLTSYITQLESQGSLVSQETIETLTIQYGLDKPGYIRYFQWFGRILRSELGISFEYNRPVTELLAERLPYSIAISLCALFVTYAIAIPIGIYSATHQYSVTDYGFTVFGFIGLATPNFILALILMFLFYKWFGLSIGGLFSTEYLIAPWSWGKLWNMLAHMPIPLIVIGSAGTAGLIRVMRATLLDELQKQYVITARAKGVKEKRLIFRYPVRVALNPIVSAVGWILPGIISGETITSIVLSLPTTGPLLTRALLAQDMYLAGGIVLIYALLVIVGTFVSDILLVWIDPRIRLLKMAAE